MAGLIPAESNKDMFDLYQQNKKDLKKISIYLNTIMSTDKVKEREALKRKERMKD